MREVIERDLGAAEPLFDQRGWNASDSGIIRSLEHVLHARGSTLDLVAVALLAYGALQLAEGVGLWRLRRWGEYLTVVATALFLPLEIYELTERITALLRHGRRPRRSEGRRRSTREARPVAAQVQQTVQGRIAADGAVRARRLGAQVHLLRAHSWTR